MTLHKDVLSQNDFELFGLEVVFDVEPNNLADRFRELQQALHPDKFAAASNSEKRWSVQAASRVNDAYQRLKAPLKRASYLLELKGISLDEETDTKMNPMFLMEQMELRESLEEIDDSSDPFEAIDEIRVNLKRSIATQTAEFTDAYNDENFAEARTAIRQWQFLDKMRRELDEAEARIDEQLNG